MAYGLKYRNNFEGINDLTNVKYNVLLEIFQDGYVGAVTEIEELDKNPLQFRLDNSGDTHFVPIKKTSVSINIVDTGQFDYSEFYTSNAKKYKVVITSPVLNWQGYLVPQSYNSNLNYRQPFTLTASDGLHLLSSIDYVPDQSRTVTLAGFIADIESRIGLGTFDRTTTIQTEIGNVWDALIYEGMFTDLNYEEALEMVLKSIGMQLRYWKIFPVIESYNVTNSADVQIINKDISLSFLAPIKTAKVTQEITTLPDLMLNGMVDDLSDLVESNVGHVLPFDTLSKWVADPTVGGVIVNRGRSRSTSDRDTSDYYTAINLELMPVNGVKESFELTGNEISYFVCRPVNATALTFSIKANLGKVAYFSGRGSTSGLVNSKLYPAKYVELKYGIYDEISNKSFNYATMSWDITGRPTQANCNKLRITDPKDGDTTIYIETPATTGATTKVNFYLLGGSVEYVDTMLPAVAQTMVKNILSIDAIEVDGVSLVSDKELYNETSSVVDVAPNIDVLDYDISFGYCPSPPANTSLYYGSAFYHTNLAQIVNVVVQGNTIPWLQYIYQTLLYTQNVQRKKVYTCSLLLKSVVNPIWLRNTLMGDVVMTNSLTFDWKTSQISAELTEIMPYVYSAWNITSESTIGSSDWGGSGGTSGSVGGGGGSVDLSNYVVKTGATSQDIEGDISADNMVSRGAVVAGALNGTLPDDLPVATSLLYGTIKFDPTTLALNGSNQLTVIGGGGSDVSWGTPTAQYTPLIVNAVTRNLSLDGHTHSYLPLSGGTMQDSAPIFYSNGYRYITNSGSSWYIAANDGGNIYLETNGADPFVRKSGINYDIWHAGNDGAGSGLDAGKLAGTEPFFIFKPFNIVSNSNIDFNTYQFQIGTTFWSGGNGTGNANTPFDYGQVVELGNRSGNYGHSLMIAASNDNILKYRNCYLYDGAGGGFGPWKTFAFTDSNVASATKLANTRTIWGQNFNGEGNVSGPFMLDGIGNSQLSIYNNGSSREIQSYNGFLSLNPGGNNVLIGTRTNSGYILDVNGTFRTTGAAYLNSTLSVAGHATFNSDILIPRENAWGYIKNTSVRGGIKIGTGNDSGTYVDAISITTAGNYVRSEIPFIANVTLSVTGASTLIGLLTANGGISATTGTFSSYLTANRFYTGYDSGLANAISCSNWFRSNGATGWLNATYSAGILSDTANIVRTYNTNKFKVYNTAIDSILTLGGVTAANVISSGAVVAGALNGTLPDDLPIATGSLFGVIKTGLSIHNNAGIININGRHYTTTSTYTDAACREITAELVLGTGNMTSGTLDQIQLAFAPLTTTRGLTGNIIATATGDGMSLTISFRKDTGSGRWYLMIYNGTAATVVRNGILISIRGQQTI